MAEEAKKDERSLFDKLFGKSTDELSAIEAAEQEAPPVPAGPAGPTPEQLEEQKILERIKQFRQKEGRDVDTGKKTGSVHEFDKAFADLGEVDPAARHVLPEEPASREEEEALSKQVLPALEYIYDTGLPKVITAMKSNPDLYDGISQVAVQVIKKQHADATKNGVPVNPSVYFGENGMMHTVVDALTEVAQQAKLPGAFDQDQYAAALINTFRLVGEHISNSGDEAAMGEAEELLMDMALTLEDGTMLETREQADEVAMAQTRDNALQQSVQKGLQDTINRPGPRQVTPLQGRV
jgi:hypothetical protein